jgi:hypothetical protein
MATSANAPDFGPIALPIRYPSCILETSFLATKHFYRRKAGILWALMGRLIGRKSRIYGFTDADRMRGRYKDS